MKTNTLIQLPVSELKAVLPGLTKVIQRRSTLPILACVRMESSPQGEVSLQATDLDDYVTVSLREARPTQSGAFMVPWEPLAKVIKSASGQESIVLIKEGKTEVTLRTFIGNNPVDQKLDVPEVKEWPTLPVITDAGILVASELRQALQEAFAWASQDESRLILNSAYLDVSDQQAHYVVSTNGRTLFSANSFHLDLKESLVIPHRKFLGWSGAWEEETCRLAHEPGKLNEKTKQRGDGWVRFQTDRWSFITRQIEGVFPNWKQAMPTPNGRWTLIQLSDQAIKQMLQVIPKLPGDLSPNHPVRLRVSGERLLLEGQNRDQNEWTSIPVPDCRITGRALAVGLNRHYLLGALRLGLSRLEIEDAMSPVVFTQGGKRVVIMPVNLEAHKTTAAAHHSDEAANAQTPTSTNATQPDSSSPAQTENQNQNQTNQERTDMSKTTSSVTATTSATTENPAAASAIKTVIEQVERIKETLKGVLSDFSDVLASLKLAEKEKKVTEKEIEAIRATLRTIQNVKI